MVTSRFLLYNKINNLISDLFFFFFSKNVFLEFRLAIYLHINNVAVYQNQLCIPAMICLYLDTTHNVHIIIYICYKLTN